MTDKCIQCTDLQRTNQHRLNPYLLPIFYESSDIITNLNLPRKYTSTHNDTTAEIYISIGHDYNKYLLSSEEVINNQTQVTGKWIYNQDKHRHEIHLQVDVSTIKNPNAELRNTIFCAELGPVLEGIAFAETALLEKHPKLGNTRILVHFKSIDEKYDRIEKWHRLKYWAPSISHTNSHDNKESKKYDNKESKRYDNRSPQICTTCRK